MALTRRTILAALQHCLLYSGQLDSKSRRGHRWLAVVAFGRYQRPADAFTEKVGHGWLASEPPQKDAIVTSWTLPGILRRSRLPRPFQNLDQFSHDRLVSFHFRQLHSLHSH